MPATQRWQHAFCLSTGLYLLATIAIFHRRRSVLVACTLEKRSPCAGSPLRRPATACSRCTIRMFAMHARCPTHAAAEPLAAAAASPAPTWRRHRHPRASSPPTSPFSSHHAHPRRQRCAVPQAEAKQQQLEQPAAPSGGSTSGAGTVRTASEAARAYYSGGCTGQGQARGVIDMPVMHGGRVGGQSRATVGQRQRDKGELGTRTSPVLVPSITRARSAAQLGTTSAWTTCLA